MIRRCLVVALILAVLCAPALCENFSFAVFGDVQGGNSVFLDLISKMNMDPDIRFAVSLGDRVPNGTVAEHTDFDKLASTSKARIFGVLGNHDVGAFGQGKKYFSSRYSGEYYYFDSGGCRFVFLNNSSNKGLGNEQWQWLERVIATELPTFVFMHKPLFDISGTWEKHIMYPSAERAKLKDLFKTRENVKYVFAGHIHSYGKALEDGKIYIVSAGAGAPLYVPAFNGGYYHYVKVTIDSDRISEKVVWVYDEDKGIYENK